MNKKIYIDTDRYSLKGVLFNAPGKDISISIAMRYKLRNSQVAAEELRIKNAVKEWFLDSRLLIPEHLIINLDTPYYSNDRLASMVFRLDISVASREVIQDGHTGFKDFFTPECERLIQVLDEYVY